MASPKMYYDPEEGPARCEKCHKIIYVCPLICIGSRGSIPARTIVCGRVDVAKIITCERCGYWGMCDECGETCDHEDDKYCTLPFDIDGCGGPVWQLKCDEKCRGECIVALVANNLFE
jgi:hypothetical protein